MGYTRVIYVLSSSVYVYCESRGDLDCKVTTVMSTTEPCTLQRSNHISPQRGQVKGYKIWV